jgi:Domain of unknown function (DUF4386)
MNPQTIARVTGVLFLITFITSIPAFFVFYAPVLGDPRYIVGAGADNSVLVGAFLELILNIANIGTAVVLFPILKRVNEILALGYVTARLVECTFIAVGILSLLSIVTLRQEAAGADAGSLVAVGRSLVALHDWTFLLGPGFVVGIGNALMLGYLMYSSRLVPWGMALLGLIGGPLNTASGTAVLFGSSRQGGVAGHRDHPGVPLGVVARHMAHGEGIQYICVRSLTARITVSDMSDGIRHARRSPGLALIHWSAWT